MRETNMKRLNITKEQFNRSRYFKNKYGRLEYVSESGKLFKTSKGKVLKFNENIHHQDVESLDVPVTDEEGELAALIEQSIEEEFGLSCSCEPHQQGEEMHLEIFVEAPRRGINRMCSKLEEFVNNIGKQAKKDYGIEWGDAHFDAANGDEIFGELWPLEGEYAIQPGELARESKRKFMMFKESVNDRKS